MIPILLALAAAAPAAAGPQDDPERRYKACVATARTDPAAAISTADRWRQSGGGLPARMCLGMAYAAQGSWASAALAFEQGALEAKDDPRLADFWVQAGNARLAAGEYDKAKRAFEAALATTLLTPELRGEVHLDRARAEVALGDPGAARADIDKALELVPGDPFGWYLSAALARRQDDLPRAQKDIAEAARLAPDDASILLEAGNIAGLSGEVEAAQGLYARAARISPNSDAGRAAAAALAANEAGAK